MKLNTTHTPDAHLNPIPTIYDGPTPYASLFENLIKLILLRTSTLCTTNDTHTHTPIDKATMVHPFNLFVPIYYYYYRA